MSDTKTILEAPSLRCPRSLPFPEAHKCEFTLNIGMFFDGTDNNRNIEEAYVNTNVTRLWEAYRDDPDWGYFRYYVSGIGTPFTEIGEKEAPTLGGPAGAGGEARILYGLLQVINSVHRFVNSHDALFDAEDLAALCSDARVARSGIDDNYPQAPSATQDILRKWGLSQGLVGSDALYGKHKGPRDAFFSKRFMELRRQLYARDTRPKIAGIYLDIFGFSRGAAQARVFTTWLHEWLLIVGELFGAPSYVRMLGLFDTVASVGATDAAGSDGHNDWASAEDLRIHPKVKNCVHYVALHELRTNFPADSVVIDGVLPHNCQEHHCPGVHSDVGGGYAAGEQGKGIREELIDPRVSRSHGGGVRYVPDEGLKLSNLTLNHMYKAVKRVCSGHPDVPWIEGGSKEADVRNLPERFGVASLAKVERAVTAYFDHCGVPTGLSTYDALRQHGLRYLAWRYQVNKEGGFGQLPSVMRAETTDADRLIYYRQGQALFRQQVGLLENPPGGFDFADNKDTYAGYNRHAGEIYKEMKRTAIEWELGRFFDDWVHDSYAGFIGKFQAKKTNWIKTVLGNATHRVAEAQGYVRWRQMYAGGNEGLNALAPAEAGSAEA